MSNRRTHHRIPMKRLDKIRVHAPAWAKRSVIKPPTVRDRMRAFGMRWAGLLGSVAVHSLVLVLAAATFTVGKRVVTKTQEHYIVPDATIIEGAEVGGVPNPGLGPDPTRKAASDDGPEMANIDAWAKKPSKQLQAAVMDNNDDATESTIGVGTHTLAGTGVGDTADGGTSAPFGMPGGGGGMAIKSTFMGLSGKAKKIVYVCDGSGSMADRMSLLVQELTASINRLQPIQGFDVIFFNDSGEQSFAGGLVPGNGNHLRELGNWLGTVKITHGSDPRGSLELAFREDPDLVYLLTDGAFTSGDDKHSDCSNDKVIDLVRFLNKDKRVKINTIAFSSAPTEADVTEDYISTLKLIANESGGLFKFVSSSQMRQ